ncbi:hypothetical protein GALMADRAFT_241632 [Galerina marginata CBS 339.88]|uniref:Uncharacterized protein n=1 Tax=Galerina marginata (strain CBS 339.88) TaxID=685588 RepID=A0A067TPX8_GALM3|nr:hypothetical protein GALMADRAFT_241632 [Galerina marginata CBS 339.88]
MVYVNFDTAITERFHVVLEGWPLEKFCAPSSIASRNELSVLLASLESGSTRFRKLTAEEFQQWSNQRFDASLGITAEQCASPPADSASEPTEPAVETPEPPNPEPLVEPSPSESSAPSAPLEQPVGQESSVSPTSGLENPVVTTSTVPAKRKLAANDDTVKQRRRPLAGAFINSGVTSSNGATVMVPATRRKERSDKNKKRGPRAKKSS